jgi:hypothetical protein
MNTASTLSKSCPAKEPSCPNLDLRERRESRDSGVVIKTKGK